MWPCVIMMWYSSPVSLSQYCGYEHVHVSEGSVRTPIRRMANSVAILLQIYKYLHAKNYQNRSCVDKVIE